MPGFESHQMTVRAVRGSPAYSALEKTVTIERSAIWKGRAIVGATSNKYDQTEFEGFLRRFDFELLFEVASPLNPFFKYLILRRE